jgi:hypothetical protein
MFSEDPNIIQLAPKIFHYPNFFNKEDLDLVDKIIASGEIQEKQHPLEEKAEELGRDEINFRPTTESFALKPIWDKISEFLYPEYVIHPQLHLLKYGVGSFMEAHCDSPGEGHHDHLTIEDSWKTCTMLSWGVCGYFGEWEGGEIYYPQHDVEVSVKAGDLVIHGALSDYMHGVKPITSGTRYVFSNFSLAANKNPGTFPNYKTDEYYEAIKDLSKWNSVKKIDGLALLKSLIK